eukprot:12044213-Alexandrium_andersonii.AAC.1
MPSLRVRERAGRLTHVPGCGGDVSELAHVHAGARGGLPPSWRWGTRWRALGGVALQAIENQLM